MTEKISGGAFKQMVAFGAACITREKQAINDLNVFPVPDGDTGTNMSLTIQTAAAELKKCEPATVGEAAKITASALLRGARGNSGVILSLLFRGLSKSAKGLEEMDGVQLAAAMSEGVTTAYGAVMKPAEGTVLTVSRLAAARAEEAAQEQNCAEYVLAEAIATGYETLAETTEMNPVLKKAGVVDAGGKGYLIILEGMLSSLRGEPMPEVEEEPEHDKADFAAIGDEDITFAFDTVFIVRKNDPNVDLAPFRAYLDSIGDSLVIGEDDESFKVHVHTNIPGEALTESQKYGTLELAKIENMQGIQNLEEIITAADGIMVARGDMGVEIPLEEVPILQKKMIKMAVAQGKHGVDNIDSIIEAADGIMIARGDMGVEIPLEDVPVIQKDIIAKVYSAGKQVITATQMLDSMIKNPRPTRAEATDIANAIYDGTTAIMLSGESAAGLYPVEAVKTMSRIAERAEQDIDYRGRMQRVKEDRQETPDITTAISYATCSVASDLNAAAIITVTMSGFTANMIARYKPGCQIIGCTLDEKVYRQLNLLWGVKPVMIQKERTTDALFEEAVFKAKQAGLVKTGDTVVITAGVPLGVVGKTDMIHVVEVE